MSDPTLLLIHGLGATSGVWADVVDRLDWPGRVVTPDVLGHGSAPWSGDYTVGALAAGVASHCERNEPTVIVGHSMGGAIGLCLSAGFFRPNVQAVIGLGVKVHWTDEEVAGVAKVAARGIRWFDTEAEAKDRFLLQSGLKGLIGSDHNALTDAVAQDGERWRVSQDPATFAQNALQTRALLDAATCPVTLGAGADDAMVSSDDLTEFVHEPRMAPGCGHNLQVENPGWIVDLLAEVIAGPAMEVNR